MNGPFVTRCLVSVGLVWLGTVLFAAPGNSPASGPATNPTSPNNPNAPSGIERRFISLEDIQKIRRGELRNGDTTRVSIPQDVRRSYASRAGFSFAEFNAKPALQQALDILGSDVEESMKSQVRVTTDPASLVEFKKLQPMIVSGCAAISCHGSVNGGGLVLFPAESDLASYTNFYILTRYAKKMVEQPGGGMFGGPAEHKAIERHRGEMSLLAQYGLPNTKATLQHPKVTGYNGIFRDQEDPRFKRLTSWMNDSLNPIEPNYQINYNVPRGKNYQPPPTTGPSTRPGTTRPAAPAPNAPPTSPSPGR